MGVIEIENVQKKFRIYYDKSHSLKEKLLFKNRNYYEDRWVLKGVNLQVEKGQAVGIIGKNGCGKSTLLKLMSQIMYPDKGKIEMKGRVSSLIELGAGFHQDMSGRENIFTNASIFGLTHNEISSRIEEIISFSELHEYIDNPVRTYSSGMYMRLAFAVAINVDADILLIDEILAVGDASYQAKCFNKLREIKANGTTIVIVSHSLGQIEQICDQSVWIDDGVIRMSGEPMDVHPAYTEYMNKKTKMIEPQDVPHEEEENAEHQTNRWGSREAEIVAVVLQNQDGEESQAFQTGTPVTIKISYCAHRAIENPIFGIGIFRNDGVHCYGTNTYIDRIDIPTVKDYGVVYFDISEANLLEGEYFLDVAIEGEASMIAYDYCRGLLRFRMYNATPGEVGIMRLSHNWKHEA
jgi:ABC-2 type transport system ATP-binding protein